MELTPIRVMIVDDHPLMRGGLHDLFAPVEGIEVVATAADGQEAVELDAIHTPDVVLMDIEMPGIDGVEATRRLLARRDDAMIVILTTFADQPKIVAALDAGAVGYLLKDATPDEIVRGVRAAHQGEAPISPRAAKELLRSRREPASAVLTTREREVLQLVVAGLANKQIARRLAISEKTVKAHLTRVFAAIGVQDRTQAALWAARNGIEAPT